MSRLSVSAIVVVRNGERFLAQALDSVLSQTRPADEVLVIDGGSTDATAEIARSFAPVRLLQQPGTGLANARNAGVGAATRELVAFLDHDDLWLPRKLEVQIARLEADPDLDYCHVHVRLFVEPGTPLRPGFTREFLEREHRGRTPGALVARRALFARIGGFDERYAIGADAEWFARAADLKTNGLEIAEPLLAKRIHAANLSADAARNRHELLNVIKRSLERRRGRGEPGC